MSDSKPAFFLSFAPLFSILFQTRLKEIITSFQTVFEVLVVFYCKSSMIKKEPNVLSWVQEESHYVLFIGCKMVVSLKIKYCHFCLPSVL